MKVKGLTLVSKSIESSSSFHFERRLPDFSESRWLESAVQFPSLFASINLLG